MVFYFFRLSIDTSEDSILEFSQAIVIFIAQLLFLLHAIKTIPMGERAVSVAYALLMLTFLTRELDVETFALPDILIYYFGEAGKTDTFRVLWAVYLLYLFIFVKVSWQQIKRYFVSYQGQLLIYTAVLLIFSQLMDKNIFHMHNYTHRFYEEIFELLSYAYFVVIAVLRIKKS
jgi:hypothetical protein